MALIRDRHGRDPVEESARRGDTTVRTDDRAREKLEGVNLGAAVIGWLVAVAVGIVLTSVIGALVTAVGFEAHRTAGHAGRRRARSGVRLAVQHPRPGQPARASPTAITPGWTGRRGAERRLRRRESGEVAAGFSLGVVNTTVGANATSFSQTVARGRTFYYRVLAFNDAHQSAWSNTATVTTP